MNQTMNHPKKEPKFINVYNRPIIIVGEKMGEQRPGQDRYALEGNRTGDFVHEAIEGLENIILTNVVNRYYPGDFDHGKYVGEGILDLIELIEEYKPSKIICLGNIAKDYIRSLKVMPDDCKIFNMPHPSYINRFKSSMRHEYIKQLRDELIS